MYLVYLGESGNTGNSVNDPNQPHHVHVGLLVHDSQSISINGEFDALYRRHFGHAPGEPGAPKGLRPGELYQGIGPFSSWTLAKRHQLIQDCLDILIRRRAPLIIAYVNKQDFQQANASGDDSKTRGQSTTESTINRLLLALNLYLDELNLTAMTHQQLISTEWRIRDFALVVAGDGSSVRPVFMNQFLKSDDGIDASGLVETLCFADSEHSVGTQLANICAYFTRRWLQNPAGSHPYFTALQDHQVVQVIYPVQL